MLNYLRNMKSVYEEWSSAKPAGTPKTKLECGTQINWWLILAEVLNCWSLFIWCGIANELVWKNKRTGFCLEDADGEEIQFTIEHVNSIRITFSLQKTKHFRFKAHREQQILLPSTYTFFIALIRTWINIELCCRVQCIKNHKIRTRQMIYLIEIF